MEVFYIIKNELPINEEIHDKEIRLIDSDGAMLGIGAIKDAREMVE